MLLLARVAKEAAKPKVSTKGPVKKYLTLAEAMVTEYDHNSH